MADRQRVYHPVTGEAFDVPVFKAVELRLDKGWLSQPLDPDAVPYVQTVEPAEQPRRDRFPKGVPDRSYIRGFLNDGASRVIEVGCDEACEATDNVGHQHPSSLDEEDDGGRQ